MMAGKKGKMKVDELEILVPINFDLSRFDDEVIHAEIARRKRASGQNLGGRPANLQPCPTCGAPTTARQRRTVAPCGHRFKRR